jgi:hypothetical protein
MGKAITTAKKKRKIIPAIFPGGFMGIIIILFSL